MAKNKTNLLFDFNQTLFLNDSQVQLSNATEVPYIPYESRPETYIIPIVFALIFIIGVIGNATLVLVFLKHRSMSTIPNT